MISFLLFLLFLIFAGLPSIAADDAVPVDPDQLERDRAMDRLYAEWNRPGMPGCAVAVYRDGRIVRARGYGRADLEADVPIRPSTVFHVASVSKQFTAFAIHLLAQDGKLSLDDDVREYLPELHDFGQPITLRRLLHHTSGLRDQWDLLLLAGWRFSDLITEEDILRLIWRQRDLNFRPGDRMLYCNTGYTLLGQIVKRVSGESLREFCEKRIFRPLAMNSTHFHNDATEVVPLRAHSYDRGEDGGMRNAILSFSNDGATSLFTTVEDLAKWDRNWIDGKVGGKQLLAEMSRSGRTNNDAEIGYGSGVAIGRQGERETVSHGGADAGFRSFYLRFPAEKLSVVVLANRGDIDPGRLAFATADLYLSPVLPEAGGEEEPAPYSKETQAEKPTELVREAQPEAKNNDGAPGNRGKGFAARRSLRGYEGRYYSPELDSFFDIQLRDGRLFARNQRHAFGLEPAGLDRFAGGPVSIEFDRGSRGAARGAWLSTGRVLRLRVERVSIRYR